ncbi:prostatic spermine-binding protein-like [Trichosurus vulpecula]|uniref:prostatic spermine-binding protein-like n=1 Tax=Trichosurus vulpecula TaxID=9337 RepID=UPI00186ADBB0|nr:prostatic spermine-binding protein-like [Trichosurus vulpecula]
MRSFLVLVLVGGIVCSFHGVLSGELSGFGTLFSISENRPGDSVRALKLFIGPLGVLKGIQVKLEDGWSSKYGVPGGKAQTITLYDGEGITRLSGQGGLCVRSVVLETSTGRVLKYGTPTGSNFDDSPPYEGMELSGIEGLYGALCIKQLQGKWSYSTEIFATTEIPATAEQAEVTP